LWSDVRTNSNTRKLTTQKKEPSSGDRPTGVYFTESVAGR
jgi:hypothetical protein